ncbi:hypothetical protein Peur_015295 [Populus x canadensis]
MFLTNHHHHLLQVSCSNLLSLPHVCIVSRPGHGSPGDYSSPGKQQLEKMAKDLFLAFRCYCTRKDVHCLDVALESTDIAKAITEYVSHAAIETVVLGTPSRSGFMRKNRLLFPTKETQFYLKCTPFGIVVRAHLIPMVLLYRKFKADVPSTVSRGAPDFCTVYVVSKGKVSTVRNASRPAPFASPLLDQIQNQKNQNSPRVDSSEALYKHVSSIKERTMLVKRRISVGETFSSPFGRGGQGHSVKSFADLMSETDISFISSSRPSADRMSSDDMESEMRRLKLELKQTMDLYNAACREALTAKRKATELNCWRIEEERRLEESRFSEEAALSIIEQEKARCREAIEAAEEAKKRAAIEAQRRLNIEKALKEAAKTKRAKDNLSYHGIRYRRYSIEEIEVATQYFSESKKIGEGGYGPVYNCYVHHTPVAVKVLRPDAAQGRSQFQREVEVLSLIRHPNMVLLLGACPEYAEIATGLLFLHQTKPEPLVHRDLKPGNILLDNNYTSKISDVGLARLVLTTSENVTQYHMTSAAGTFCYIDPEYQQTGMLGVKSDVYSLGILLLQVITAKPPMGLTHIVEQAIENEALKEILDSDVPDWPIEETLCFAKLALQCAELRRKDRPDLGKELLPELNRLRDLAEEKVNYLFFAKGFGPSPNHSLASITPPISQISITPTNLSQVSITQEAMSNTVVGDLGSPKSQSST